VWTLQTLCRACRCRCVACPAAVDRRSPTHGSSTAAPRRPHATVETSMPLPSHRAVTSPAQGARRDVIQGQSLPVPLPSCLPGCREDFSSPNRLPAPIKSPARLPTLPRTATIEPPSSLGTRAPPPRAPPPPVRHHPRTRLCSPSQPKVGRGIDSPCSPLRFTLLPDRRRGPAHQQSLPAALPRAAFLPLSILNRGGGRRWLFGRKALGLFLFPPSPLSLFSLSPFF
jgi:hypothetical protein